MAASLIACGALWAYSLAPSHPEVKRAEFVISSYASVGLLCAEILPWVWRMSEQWKVDPDYTTLWAATLLLSACAAVYLAVAAGRKKSTVYLAGVLPLFAAWICALQAYWRHQNIELMMFGNPRFITSILTLMLIFAWAVYMRSDQDELPEVKEGVTPMYTWFTVSLLALLSVEPAGWLYRNTIDPQQAAWTAQMAVTIVWGLYATAMLSIGFWRRIMPLRLAALALFGITAIKLLAVDMAHIDKIFRIISFFVMGILMIGASYLYHKAEKRLKQYDEFSDNE
jgi:uncharacterized membrane protein